MSRPSSQEQVAPAAENTEALEIIREEQCSPALSSVNMNAVSVVKPPDETACTQCGCQKEIEVINSPMDAGELEKVLVEREESLRKEFQKNMDKEINDLKERFDFILQNEQLRASYMLREAHRERHEKISALQTQLECKNLAGLMYVMCTERRKSKLQRMRLVEEYTGYIRALQSILADGQDLILRLSRGYKTAARVDHEWREKMKKIVTEFQAYVYHFNGGPPETNQYIFDLPALLKSETPVHENPKEDPIEHQEEQTPVIQEEEAEEDQPWWEKIEGDCRPFVMFGDMAEFKPPQRRAVLGVIKAAKTAPQKWKDYGKDFVRERNVIGGVFNEMFLNSECSNADVIKDEYPKRVPAPPKWVCQAMQTDWNSKTSLVSPRDRATATSTDVRGNMGSILKIITSNIQSGTNRANLLAARDSLEIASTIQLASRLDQYDYSKEEDDEDEEIDCQPSRKRESLDDEEEESLSMLGSIHKDSLQVIPAHAPDKDHKINYEKVCPMEKCQRMQMDSFVRSLPPYMRANPYIHFEQTYEDYETCTPDQIEILKQRIEHKRRKECEEDIAEESPLDEWTHETDGVGVQTSDMSLPPCTCRVPSPTPVSSTGKMFNLADLYPIKQTLNEIRKDCFYDGMIEFDRFKVIGQDSVETIKTVPKEDFNKTRLYEIKKILKQHPSLCEIFQANTQ